MIKNFISKNFITLILAVFIVILMLQRCGSSGGDKIIPIKDSVRTEISWKVRDSIIYKDRLVPVKHEVNNSYTEYVPSQDYDELKEQFLSFRDSLFTNNIYIDKSSYDSSNIIITDTVGRNRILGRSIEWKMKYPEKTTTIIRTVDNTKKPRTQVYFGGGISGNSLNIPSEINAGFLLKNKKDQIYGVSLGLDRKANINYGVSMYWKIKLRK